MVTRRNPLTLRSAEAGAEGTSAGSSLMSAGGDKRLPLAQIRTDGGTQMRAGLNEETVQEYAEALAGPGGWPFPPLVVFYDGEAYWLGDGFHRLEAARRATGYGVEAVPCQVLPGTRRDAVLCAAGANAAHGLRRTKADKRRAAESLLRDGGWGQWGDTEIARRCRVSHPFVSKLREETVVSDPVHTGNRYQYDSVEPAAENPQTGVTIDTDHVVHYERTFIHPKTGQPATMRLRRAEPVEKRVLTATETRALLWRMMQADLAGKETVTVQAMLQCLLRRGEQVEAYASFHTKEEHLDPATFAEAYATVKADLEKRVAHMRRRGAPATTSESEFAGQPVGAGPISQPATFRPVAPVANGARLRMPRPMWVDLLRKLYGEALTMVEAYAWLTGNEERAASLRLALEAVVEELGSMEKGGADESTGCSL